MLNKIIGFFLYNRLVTLLTLVILIAWGITNSPFNWDTGILPSDPVPVDAIPDIGENQQIVYTEWAGRSPQDIEDQISYPLTTSLLGIPGVKTIRSNSIFGMSSIYIIFKEGVDFYWSRTRILEKLNSLPKGILPKDISPTLGPDATALGQIYWYTLEGRDKYGKPAGGWDPHELRSIQDFYIKYALSSAEGVAEVASIGGFVKEYQIDIDPDAMKAHGVNIAQLIAAVKNSNLDIGARTIEFNKVEYLIRALGYIKSLKDLEDAVVITRDNVPIRIKDVAKVNFGPATRRGGLDKGGSEAVGGVVVARYGANPMKTIENLKKKIDEISPGLASKTLKDGSVSKLTIVPFYDRTNLIKETLGTLEEALSLEILISILVIIVLVLNLRASFLISSILPLGVLMTFIAMRQFKVDANIVALSGIAIAIGVMIDVGIVFTENIIRHINLVENIGARGKELLHVIYKATTEVAGAVVTALSTTIVSFLPIFAMQAAEGKLFRPLAFTKTFAMFAALLIGLVIIPTLAHIVFSIKIEKKRTTLILNILLIIAGITLSIFSVMIIPLALCMYALNSIFKEKLEDIYKGLSNYISIAVTILIVVYFLTKVWLPLGAQNSLFLNYVFVVVLLALILGFFAFIIQSYKRILSFCLENKWKFLSLPIAIVAFAFFAWSTLGKEFMPSLNEGSFLLMPTSMPHSGVQENLELIRLLDKRVNSIPEVETVVGKWGRANSALDPAPISMYENIINYRSEYILADDGHKMRFTTNDEDAYILKDGTVYNREKDGFKLFSKDELIVDKNGEYFRQWRDKTKSPDDIWKEIIAKAKLPGLTSAPKLQPIQTRLVMLQTGMRAPMGIKVYGPDLETIERFGYELEKYLKHVEGVTPSSVFADRIVGKPYIELVLKRDALALYGLKVTDLQMVISSAIGGMKLSNSLEGRERFPIRLRYAREFRDNPEDLKKILIPTPSGAQIPLEELVDIKYTRGAQLIKSEDTFLLGYIIFDKEDKYAEVDVVENAQKYLNEQIDKGELKVPAGVSYKFTGNYENQIRASKRLALIIPISLMVIFLILYFQFKSIPATALIFSGIIVALSGGFIMLFLYGQAWFLNFSIAGINFRELFQIHTINISVAVWVGFVALFGVATDDGVLISTYLKQLQDKRKPTNVKEIRALVLEAGSKRVRPAIMTTATTIIALMPVLTSTGKGSDIMIPMAIPLFGGMIIEVMTIFVVPVIYCMWQERKIKLEENKNN
ncbi:MAG: efflux RND transporter permease subunit [Marinifilaceae bacterium]